MTSRITRKTIIAYLERRKACQEAFDWIGDHPSYGPKRLWMSCHRGDWMLWFCWKAGIPFDAYAPAVYAAADRAVRQYTPAALRETGRKDLIEHAEKLEALDPIVDKQTARRACTAAAVAVAAVAYAAAAYAADAFAFTFTDAAFAFAVFAFAFADADAFADAFAAYAAVAAYAADAAYVYADDDDAADAAYAAADAAYAAVRTKEQRLCARQLAALVNWETVASRIKSTNGRTP